MTVLADTSAPAAKEPLVRQYASTLVSKSGTASEARVLLLRAQPSWDGPEALTVRGPGDAEVRVLVRTGVSTLAVREAIQERAGDEYLIVLTDRSDADLARLMTNLGGHDLDTILDSVRKTNRCVIVEEGWPHGGVGDLDM